MSRPSNYIVFNYFRNVWWVAQIMKHLIHYVIIFTSYFFLFIMPKHHCSVCCNRELSHKDVLRNFSEQWDLFQCFPCIFIDGIIGIITGLPWYYEKCEKSICCPRHESVQGEWRYNFAFSLPRFSMEMSRQFHPTGNNLCIELVIWWAWEPIPMFWSILWICQDFSSRSFSP